MSVHRLTLRGGRKHPVGIITGLPCCVAAPVVVKLFRGRIPISSVAVVMRGRITSEVRMKPKAGSCKTLSLTIRCCTGPGVITGMPPGYFVPEPGIKDTIVELRQCRGPPIRMGGRGLVFHVVETSFGREEGALIGNLGGSRRVPFSGRRVRRTLKVYKLSLDIEKRTLALTRFTRLTGTFARVSWGSGCGGRPITGQVLFVLHSGLFFGEGRDWLPLPTVGV